MKGDFSRDTFDKAKHFSRVLMQQGRVQLDADWNEQASILLHYIRTLAEDLIGPYGGPEANYGFEITPDGSDDFKIGAGRYYVDGILCQNDADKNHCKAKDNIEDIDKVLVKYKSQKFFPNPSDLNLAQEQTYLVYLDVWEQHVTAIEDDAIREKALGGPDTASRARVVWQVKVDDGKNGDEPLTPEYNNSKITNWDKWINRWQPDHLGCLKARVKPSENSNDPCLTQPDAKYRGHENQLYRVEIHKPGAAGKATFKWSRDNGSVVTGCELKGKNLIVYNPRGFFEKQWVELTSEEQELRGEAGSFVIVVKVEADQLTLDKELSIPNLPESEKEKWPTKVRGWDQYEKGKQTLTNGAVPVIEGTDDNNWIDLENGIQIQFQPTVNKNHIYRTGDYWLIPARVATGNIEWPVESGKDGKPIPLPKPPDGIDHHYAPLAILKWKDNSWEKELDCRCFFKQRF